jgi:hypothetical protein
MLRKLLLGAAALAALSVSEADAEITISANPTHDFNCTGGVCTATARQANMNVGDLVSLLASSDIVVAHGQKAKDIYVKAALSWSSPHGLTLDSRLSVNIYKPISVTGTGSLSIMLGSSTANLNFFPKGRISFLDTSSQFSINGVNYTLVADIATLASDIAAQPSGFFALANSYNAGPDGVYANAPIATVFQGGFEGLGNTIKYLKIKSPAPGNLVGLFSEIAGGPVRDLHLEKVRVEGGKQSTTGGLAGLCSGVLANVYVSGSISGGRDSNVGGVCGAVDSTNSFVIINNLHASGTVTGNGDNGTGAAGGVFGSTQGGGAIQVEAFSSSANVTGAKGWTVGGLIGQSEDTYIGDSYATGIVSTGDNGIAGGLVGSNAGTAVVGNCYANGFVGGGVSSTVGGFIGLNNGSVNSSYSSGGVASGSGNAVGGFIGNDTGANDLTDTYWDTTTSGQSHGVGSNTAYPGITGLTTAQFQAGLPTGLSRNFWAEDPNINGGLPYLRLVYAPQ